MNTTNSINPVLNNIKEDVMGFLNEVQLKFPDAISLASGRPDESFFDLNEFKRYFDEYVNAECEAQTKDSLTVLNEIGQYNKTQGIINNLVSNFFKEDENIHVQPQNILITVGAQEALFIAVNTLCDKKSDIIIVEDPTYVGVTYMSIISGYNIHPIEVTPDGINLNKIEKTVLRYSKLKKKIKLVYVIPDHQNPTGASMSLVNRRRILELADKYDFFILEDNAYGEFIYEGERLPSIKSLDRNNRVIYVRSFSKTLYPSLRLAAMISDQMISYLGKEVPLSELMALVKGYITVNTPSINQAILGGILLKNDFSFKKLNAGKISNLKEKRDLVIKCLNSYCNIDSIKGEQTIRWNVPAGGFFLTIYVPFRVDAAEVFHCAEKFKVIFTPMSFFYLNEGGENEIRIAFSHIKLENISKAIERLATYLKYKINQSAK
jgi:(S)-3,5-dihydroxyphenylglycine transaminase